MRRSAFLSFILLTVLGLAACEKRPAPAAGNDVMAALMVYCLPAIVAGKNAADSLASQQINELPPEQARHFDPKSSARVFEVPAARGSAVIITRTEPGLSCSIAVRETDPAAFWEASRNHIGPGTRFELVGDELPQQGGQITRRYAGTVNGKKIGLMVTMGSGQGLSAMRGGLMTMFSAEE